SPVALTDQTGLWDYNPFKALGELIRGERKFNNQQEVVDAKKAEEEARKKAEKSAAELEKLQKTAGTHPDCLVTLDMATAYAEDHAFPEGKEGEMERTGDRYAATKVGEDKTARSAADFIRILQKALDDNLLKCCNSCIQNLNIY